MHDLRRTLLLLAALPALACGDDAPVTTTLTTGTPNPSLDAGDTPDDTTNTPPTTGTPGPTTGMSGTAGTDDTGTPGTGTDTTANPATGDTTDPSGTTSASTSEGPPSTTSTTDPSGSSGETTDQTTGMSECAKDEVICEGDTAKVCDGMGGFSSETPCAKVCDEQLGGCVECHPGDFQCAGDVSQTCTNDGLGWVDADECDPVQGVTCDANTGVCTGACANLGTSYIGCDYYPVVTQQYDLYVNGPNPWAVAVANTTPQMAMVTVTKGPNPVTMVAVQPNSVQVIQLPWVNQLALGMGPSVKVVDGAYRLRSTQPVTVYQFNPLNADVTNDASLMLPVNTWTGNYLVAAWQNWNDLSIPGFYSVTASQDGTTVTVKAPKGGQSTQAGAGVNAQGNGVVMLDEGDVLQVITGFGGDLTGTIVTADKPVQTLGGHECTQVPIGVTACDHLEESMFPIESLAKEYIVVPPVQVPNDNLEKAVYVRVIASEDATTLTFTPDQPVAKFLAAAGDFVEIPTTTAKFLVAADKKILVAEYMVGQDGGFGTSDPAMLLAVPTAQFRSSYLFYAQTGWQANYVDIIAPANSMVQVDGANVGNFTPIGATGFSLAHVKLANNGNGSHTVSSNDKVGISVYGVVNYGSYWYPGGLDLEAQPQ